VTGSNVGQSHGRDSEKDTLSLSRVKSGECY